MKKAKKTFRMPNTISRDEVMAALSSPTDTRNARIAKAAEACAVETVKALNGPAVSWEDMREGWKWCPVEASSWSLLLAELERKP